MHIDPDLIESGKRAADALNKHLAANPFWQIRDRFVAIRLRDGWSDGVLYDTKPDAIRHQKGDERLYAYLSFRNLIGGADAREMAHVLQFHRMTYDAGFRLPDPDAVGGGPDVIPTTARMDAIRAAVAKALAERSQ